MDALAGPPRRFAGAIGRETRAGMFTIGGQRFTRPLVSLRTNAPVSDLADGLLGLGIIQRLDWIVDRNDGPLWVKPNTRAAPRPDYNRSGLLLEAGSTGAVIEQVGIGSPGARAGLKPGDRVIGSSFTQLQQQLVGAAGKTVPLTIQRHDGVEQILLTLEDFL